MGRFLWVLPVLALCLILHDQHGFQDVESSAHSTDTQIKTCGLGVVVSGDKQGFVSEEVVTALGLMSSLTAPTGLAAPWAAFYQIGKKDLIPLEKLLNEQPLKFFQMCLDKYDREIQGYSVLFCKQERVNKVLLKKERIFVHFREKPFSVHFNWQEGAGLARKVYYAEGENNGNMRVRPIIGWIMSKDPEGAEAMSNSRFSIKKFGVRNGLQSTVNSMTKAKEAGRLNVKYLGEFKVGDLGGRACYKFIRAPYDPPEEDGISQFTFYIDVETWMQVGSELRDVNGDLIAEYYFRNLKTNVEMDKNQFTDKGL
jgi:hypothetical protein